MDRIRWLATQLAMAILSGLSFFAGLLLLGASSAASTTFIFVLGVLVGRLNYAFGPHP